ncbi:MAG: probable exported protein STY2149 [uncultured Paraburkholderia sp.]|nr:MAG: probable exported protein STY2149 [uncultured Paraburkholderia sp.]
MLAACSNPSQTRDARGPVDTVALFPLGAYDQPFLSPADQQAHFQALYARYFGTGTSAPSPWNSAYVTMRVYRQQGADIAALQQRRIDRFDNTGKSGAAMGYGENFRPHDKAWIDAIARNMNVAQFTEAPAYQPLRRAVATANLMVRELPTTDPSFYDHRLAGEGYPFDNLQISAVRPGTPLYVLGTSVDGAWRYAQTPDVQGWVRSDGVGMASERFVDAWRAASAKSLGAVIGAFVPVRDSRGVFRFEARAGTLLPLVAASPGNAARGVARRGGPSAALQAAANANNGDLGSDAAVPPTTSRTILVPARDAEGEALIRTAELDDTQIAPMPLAATPRHLATLLKALIGRPYGWDNSGLYNDCSSELQSIFAAFGVWLPRHSSTQMSAGRMIDLSGLHARATARLSGRAWRAAAHADLYRRARDALPRQYHAQRRRRAGGISGRLGTAAGRQQPARGHRRLGDPAASRAHSRGRDAAIARGHADVPDQHTRRADGRGGARAGFRTGARRAC